MVATRNLNQLEAFIERVEDPYVRDALNNLLNFVIDLTGKGFETSGVVKADAINLSDGGTIKSKVFEGSLDPFAGNKFYEHLYVDGKIVGVVGYTQYNGLGKWRNMENTVGVDSCYFDGGTSLYNGINNIRVYNGDGMNVNKYKAIIFYVD